MDTIVLQELVRCAEVGQGAASRLFTRPDGLSAETAAALNRWIAAGYDPLLLLEAVRTATEQVLSALSLSPADQTYCPLTPQAFPPPPPASYRQIEGVRAILQGHKSPDSPDAPLQTDAALDIRLLPDWLDALSRKTLTERAVAALVGMGPAVLPAVEARYQASHKDKGRLDPEGQALLRILLALTPEADLPSRLDHTEELLARQDFTALSGIVPELQSRLAAGIQDPTVRERFYNFFTKLLPILICRPGSYVFLVGICLEAIAAYAAPRSTSFLEEMLQLCEHQIRKEAHS